MIIGYLIVTSSFTTLGLSAPYSRLAADAGTPNAYEILSIHYPLVVESSAQRSQVSFSSFVATKQYSPTGDPPTDLIFLTEIAPKTLISVLDSV
jgi:hypothetical protein